VKRICVMLTALEPSADVLGAALMEALRGRLGGDVRFVGVGGPAMAAHGLASEFDPSSLAVVGAFNALGAYPTVLRRVGELAELARLERPDLAVLIDSWGFSIRMAAALRRATPRPMVVKYVAPQVWATRPGRARQLARVVDQLLSTTVFDSPYFEQYGLPTRFVGAPALAGRAAMARPAAFRQAMGIGPDEPLLLVLPGSRKGEVDRLMPRFGDAVRRLRKDRPGLRVLVVAAESVEAQVGALLRSWGPDAGIRICDAERRFDAMAAATLALACSGTVTSELAVAGCPMVVAYRLDPLTWLVAKAMIRTPYITLINVAARRFIAPEFVQGRCTGARLARALADLLDNPARREAQSRAQTKSLEMLRGGIDDPAGAAADALLEILETRGAGQPLASS
jgi:lipid-A-disaccharide synthase